jgi:hypothetical protein
MYYELSAVFFRTLLEGVEACNTGGATSKFEHTCNIAACSSSSNERL